jgi:NADH-quinone oxidoreductase subunit L
MLEGLVTYSWLIPVLPLLGAIVAGFFGAKYLKGQSHWPIWIGVGGAAVWSLLILVTMFFSVPGADHDDHAAAADGTHFIAADVDPAALVGPVVTVPTVEHRSHWYTWFAAGDPEQKGMSLAADGVAGYFEVKAGAFIDPLTAVMLSVVCGIGFLITVFAAGYMKGEDGYWRFFAYLGLFIFFMTNLVMGENLIMLYLGWEGVGLCSYLLIGYYYQKPAARAAAKKAFLVNRVGDFGFAIGIMLLFYLFGTVSYFGDGINPGFVELMLDPVAAGVAADKLWLVDLVPFCLMLGAFGKSAQFPLYVWLPDAMEGPTPVSALIHAATMVTAGIYMIARLSTAFVGNEAAMLTIAVVGAFTALFAGTIALRQFDLKKVFAYSTVSQLGFMFVGVAVLAPAAAVFHLVTHAFFKALLFLSSGVVMHAMLGHLDMRQMSGLKKVLPKTRIVMLIGCVALAGLPLTSGFFSKDEIIHFAKVSGRGWETYLLFGILTLTAFFTAYYTFRLYFRVFEGPHLVPTDPHPDHHHDDAHDEAHASHAAVDAGTVATSGVDHAAVHHDEHHHDHEPRIMMWPLYILAIGALLGGLLNFPGIHTLGHFLGHSPSFTLGFAKADAALYTEGAMRTGEMATIWGQTAYGHAAIPWLGFLIAAVVSLAGVGAAWFFHLKDRAAGDKLASTFGGLSRLLEGKYWVDQIYDAVIVRPLRVLGRILFALDQYLIDAAASLLAWLPRGGGNLAALSQQGRLQGYALGSLLGAAFLLLLVFVPMAPWLLITLAVLVGLAIFILPALRRVMLGS